MEISTPAFCPNCNADLPSHFCSECGQKRIAPHDYSLKHFFAHSLHEITHFDSKIFRSLLPLLCKPGLLTEEYLAGKRARFIKPVTLFILLNIFFFLVGYRMGLLNWNMQGVIAGPYTGLANKLVEKKMAASGQSREEFEAHFNEVLSHQQRNMFFFIIPLFAVALKFFYLRSRRYYVEHLIYSIHFHSFFLIFLTLGLPLLIFLMGLFDLVLGTKLGPFFGRDPGILIPLVAGMVLYNFLALKRVYHQSWLVTGIKTAGLLLCELAIITFIYRPILFFLTFYMLRQ